MRISLIHLESIWLVKTLQIIFSNHLVIVFTLKGILDILELQNKTLTVFLFIVNNVNNKPAWSDYKTTNDKMQEGSGFESNFFS